MIYNLRLYRVIIPRLSANPISADNQTEAEQAGHLQVTSFKVDARDHDHDAAGNDDDYDSTSKPETMCGHVRPKNVALASFLNA